MFFWSSSEDSKLVELFLSGRPSDSLREAAEDGPADELDKVVLAPSFPSFPRFPYLFWKKTIEFQEIIS